jgi:nucleoside-diphosphate-sugar epimerase
MSFLRFHDRSAGSLSRRSDSPPSIARWSYSTAKAFGEAITLGYHRERDSDNVVVRLFNTVGPAHGPDSSADLFRQLDDDPLGAADVAEPVAVLVAHQLADELGAAGL